MNISSLSTMWGAGRFAQAPEFVRTAQAMGFDKVEMNHQVTQENLQEFVGLVDAGLASISSVHAPCPRWTGPAPLPELSALDEGERVAAVGIVKGAVDVARRVGAAAVVVHSGRVDMSLEKERALRGLFEKGQKDTQTYRMTTRELASERADKVAPYLRATIRSLAEIQQHARHSGIKIGLETRYHYHEIPLLDEMETLLSSLDPAIFHYWHDVGHAHNLEALGFQAHEEWLKRLGRRIVGTHLHDAVGLADHRPVGTGEIDFQMVRSYLPAEAIRVCEFAGTWPREEVEAGFTRLRKMGLF